MLTQLPPTRHRRQLLGWSVLALLAAMPAVSSANYLVTNEAAARLGLVRAWFAQVRVDPAQHQVVHWLLDKDQLFALTSAGTIQSIDAETGKTHWTAEIGAGYAGAAGIAVNSKYVAMLGSGRLYILDRADGHHLWSRPVGGAASAAPALSANYAYVVLLNGRVEGYRLDDAEASVWQYQSQGRTFQSPTTTGEVVSWPTSSGILYVGQADSPRVLFRVETSDEIVTAPAEQAPYLYIASLDGYLYCFHELTGSEVWRYATGFAVTSRPAIVGKQAFVASEGPSLHAIDALTGLGLWRLDGATQFVALGKQHTYSMDRQGTLIAMDNETGKVAGQLATGESNSALVNDQSDRILLMDNRGLVQCLHEFAATEPIWYRESQEADATVEDKDDDAESGTAAPESAPAEPEDSSASPFETIEDAPTDGDAAGNTDSVFDDSNPFE